MEELGVGSALNSDKCFVGCNGDLSDRHIPELPTISDEFGGPSGRRCDYVGALLATKTTDMAKIAPLWFEYSKRVRDDPHAWNITDEPDVKPGDKPWIAEMYGYAFAAAKVGVRHWLYYGLQNYPAYSVGDTATVDIANLLHYTLSFSFQGYYFDKRDHEEFNYTICPKEGTVHGQEYGLFPHPPHPSELAGANDPMTLYDQLLGIYTINAINEALCQRHLSRCQPFGELDEACGFVNNISRAISLEEERLYASGALCKDLLPICTTIAEAGKCLTVFHESTLVCRMSCGNCTIVEGYSQPRNNQTGYLSSERTSNDEQSVTNRKRITSLFFVLLTVSFLLCISKCCRHKREKSN